MKKNIFAVIISFLIAIVAFNLLFFLIPFNWSLSPSCFWIIYGFTTFAFVLFFAIVLNYFKNKNKNSKFVNMHIVRTCNIGFLVQLFLTIVFLVLGNFVKIEFWIPIIPEIILASIISILLIVRRSYSTYIFRHDDEITKNSEFATSIRREIKDICYKNDNKDLDKALEKLFEVANYSDPISNPNTDIIEKEILVKVSQLRTVVHNSSVEKAIALIKDITILFSQRKDF